MDIRQLSVIYVDEQDRILVRFSSTEGEEFRLWLTRRMVTRVLEPLQDAVGHLEARKAQLPNNDAHTRRMLADLRRAEVMAQSDFSTPYGEQAEKLPLGAEPLLVTQVSMSVTQGAQMEISFNEQVAHNPNPRGFKVAMESPMAHGFIHLLQTAVGKSQWDIAATGTPLHPPSTEDAAEGAGPRYLQ